MFHDAPPRQRATMTSRPTGTTTTSDKRSGIGNNKFNKTRGVGNDAFFAFFFSRRNRNGRVKICLLAFAVFALFMNVVVFSRDSDARLMSSETTSSSTRSFGKKMRYGTKKSATTRENDDDDRDEYDDENNEDEEDVKPSLETALLGSSLAVDSPTLTSGFKSMSYPSLAEVGDSKHTFLVAFEGDWA